MEKFRRGGCAGAEARAFCGDSSGWQTRKHSRLAYYDVVLGPRHGTRKERGRIPIPLMEP